MLPFFFILPSDEPDIHSPDCMSPFGSIYPKIVVVRRLRRFPPIKQKVTLDCRLTLGDVILACNPLIICVNLRNLRIKLRFLGLSRLTLTALERHQDLKLTVTRKPCPSRTGCICNAAPCTSAIRLTMDRPRPLPPAWVPTGR